MTAARPAMILSGLAVLLAVVVAEVDHVFFSASLFAFTRSWPAVLFQGAMVGVLSAGLSMLLFAPERRQRRRDVRLAFAKQVPSTIEREAHHAVMAQVQAPAPQHSRGSSGMAPQPQTTGDAPRAAPAMPDGHHPNEATHRSPPPTPRIRAPDPPVVKTVDNQHDADLERVSLLRERADRLKVQFALGKISPTGYKEMQRRIEADLAEAELRLADDQYVS